MIFVGETERDLFKNKSGQERDLQIRFLAVLSGYAMSEISELLETHIVRGDN